MEVLSALIGLIGVALSAWITRERKKDRDLYTETMESLEDEVLDLYRFLSAISPCPSCGYDPPFGPRSNRIQSERGRSATQASSVAR